MPYHNPTTTMGHSICNVDSKLLAHTTPYTMSAICLVHTSPACKRPSKVSIFPCIVL